MLRQTHGKIKGPPFDELSELMDGNSDAPKAIEKWLNVFIRLLRLPEPQRQAIRTELEEHLRERVRDLLLVGRTETESVRLAIEELGETLQLARRFEAANKPRLRRWLMNFTLIGCACGAVLVSALTLAPKSPSPAVVFQQQDGQLKKAMEALQSHRVDAKIETVILELAIKEVMDKVDVSVLLRKPELEIVDAWNQPITFHFNKVSLPNALDMIVAELSRDREPIDWRITDKNVIEIGVKSELDRREVALVSYDIRNIIRSIRESFDRPYENAVADVVALLHDMVEPNLWRDNGGELAHLQVVGGRVFVQAPRRMHERIEWILQQLREDAAIAPQSQGRLSGAD